MKKTKLLLSTLIFTFFIEANDINQTTLYHSEVTSSMSNADREELNRYRLEKQIQDKEKAELAEFRRVAKLEEEKKKADELAEFEAYKKEKAERENRETRDNLETNNKYALTIHPSPSDATVQITNIKPQYKDGILLKKGMYKIKVFKQGYATKRKTITLSKNTSYDITLEKQREVKGTTIIGNLMYQNQPFRKKYTWQGAKNYCQNLTLGGYTDWRLASHTELKKVANISIHRWKDFPTWHKWFKQNKNRQISNSKGMKYFVKRVFIESMQSKNAIFWSSNTKGSAYAWRVVFFGGSDYWSIKSDEYHALCVR